MARLASAARAVAADLAVSASPFAGRALPVAAGLLASFGTQPPPTGGVHDDPGHELSTGGLYESARKDRSPLPAAWQGSSKEETGRDKGANSELPPGAYPMHDDPACTTQHPDQAFGGERPQPGDVDATTPDNTSPSQEAKKSDAAQLPAHDSPSAVGAPQAKPPQAKPPQAKPPQARVASKDAQGEGAAREVAQDSTERSSSDHLDSSVKSLDGPGKGKGSGSGM